MSDTFKVFQKVAMAMTADAEKIRAGMPVIEWHELSKERPEIGDMVLIYMPNENGKGYFARGITAAEYQGINYLDNEKYWFIGQRREFNEDDITHWAYLPEPPIAESED